jgi:electron transport complex protein RnfG
VLLIGGTAQSTVLITVEEALEQVFPGATVTRETLFLSEDQRSRAEKDGGSEISSALATRYVATGEGGALVGWAYLDTHRVRTLPETLMIVLDSDGTVKRVEVVTFREPLEYMPREGWYEQYEGQQLDQDLALKRDIRPVTGATLTARATTEAVRRILAIHQVAAEDGAE